MRAARIYSLADRRWLAPPAPRRRQHFEPTRRFHPRHGQPLELHNIRGPWRPSASVDACGMFAVVWTTPSGDWWAPLHDFSPAAQLHLIEECRGLDHIANGRRAWPHGRFAE